MSQKKLKKLRKLEVVKTIKETVLEPFLGFRQILKENWKFLLVLIIGVVVLYFNSLNGAFVSDDYATIPNNPDIMNFKSGLNGWMGGLINWFLAVTFGIKSPISYHVFSLILYLMVLMVAFVFVSMVFNQNLIAKIAIILFAVLPIHVEAISWIAGRPYLLNAFFVLSALIVLISYLKTENKKYFWMFLFLTFLTFAAEKTRSTALFLLGLLYWISFDHKLKKKYNLGKVLFLFLILFFAVIIVLWPQLVNRINSVNSGYNGSGGIFYNPFFQYPLSITKYLQLMLFPTDLTLYHTMYILPTWLNWMVFILYIGTTIYFFFKDKRLFFAFAFIFLAAAPSMAPVKISWLVAERYMFLGSLGVAMVLGIFLEKILKNKKIIGLILISILVVVYGIRVYLRNVDWQTNHNLWVNTVQVSPNSHNAWNNIGDDYDKLAQLETTDSGKMKQYENAVKGFTQSTVVKPNYADAYHNRANIFYKMGRFDMARDSYETALSYSNNSLYQSLISLIQIDLTEKRADLALGHVEKLQKAKPNDVQVYYINAVVLASAGMKDQAIPILEQILKAYPTFTEAKNLLSQLKGNIKN